jgi:uncharacterized damage-inducible protein DinB
MEPTDLLIDAFGRVRDHTRGVADGLDEAALTWRPDDEANHVGWLLWHLTRVQDDHLAEIAGREQVWREGGWHERFGLAEGDDDIGYGHTPEQVAAVRPESATACVEYQAATAARTIEILEGLGREGLERIIDTSFDPPVTVAARLVSVVGDTMAHLGQAGYVRGLHERR